MAASPRDDAADLIAFFAQVVTDQLEQILFVIDDEDAFSCHIHLFRNARGLARDASWIPWQY